MSFHLNISDSATMTPKRHALKAVNTAQRFATHAPTPSARAILMAKLALYVRRVNAR